MRRAFTATVAHGIAATSAALTMVGIALELATPEAERFGVWPNALAVLGLAGGTTGALIAARSPRNPLAWLLCAGAAFAAVNVASGAAAARLLADGREDGWLAWAGWLAGWTWLPPALITVAYLPQIFPGRSPLDGRFWAWWWRASIGLGAAMLGVALTAPYVPAFPGLANPLFGAYLSPAQFAAVEPVVGLALTAATLVLTVVSIVAVIVRLRRADPAERRRIWLVAATTVLILLASSTAGSWWAVAAAILYLGSILYSVVRLRLWELDALIPRAVVGAGIVLVLGSLYLVVVAAIGALFGQSAGSVVAAFTGALIVGVFFEPLRRRVKHLVDRGFALGRADARSLSDAVARAAREAEGGRQALDRVAELLAEALRTPGLRIELGPAAEPRYAAGRADDGPAASVDVVPIAWHGDEVARVLLPPRRGATSTARRDRLVLAQLEPTLGLIAHDVLVGLDLELSRQTAVTAREEELRRIRRDLHDGLGPLLAGAALSVEVARERALGDAPPAGAVDDGLRRLLTDAADDLRSAISEIRELVYGLRPPALDLGLADAVRNTFPDPGFALSVSMDPAHATLPAAVEVAAYRIVQEALTNVARHSGASHASVDVRVEHDALRVVVRDDGVGIGAATRPGVGLSSMRERAAELGGRVSIVPARDGGTVVTAVLPCAGLEPADGDDLPAPHEPVHAGGDRRGL